MGPVGPKLAPCWPHEPCNQGRTMQCLDASNATILGQIWIVFTYFAHNVHFSSGAVNVGEVRLQINALFCRNMLSHYGLRSWVFRHFISIPTVPVYQFERQHVSEWTSFSNQIVCNIPLVILYHICILSYILIHALCRWSFIYIIRCIYCRENYVSLTTLTLVGIMGNWFRIHGRTQP